MKRPGIIMESGINVLALDDVFNARGIAETQYAQELSWLMAKFKDGLYDVMTCFSKDDFYGKLACVGSLSDVAEKIRPALSRWRTGGYSEAAEALA